MTEDDNQTKPENKEFDFSAFPSNTLFHERRYGRDRRKPGNDSAKGNGLPGSPERVRPERRERKERRRRIDPTTFEKQYTDDELEFMNAMQRFKEQSGKAFPTHGDVIKIAVSLGYRKPVWDDEFSTGDVEPFDGLAHFAGL